uniref:C-type lectin domain-containing protein n=1 Tax=Seriola dumerili TaxID=41447 RepID=A0A3B4TU34_SERDU
MILLLFLFGLTLGAESPSDKHYHRKLQRGNCPMFWFSFNGRVAATHMSWADAELHCVSERANLVSIHSLEEHHFVKDPMKSFDPGPTWIGLSDTQKEGRWMWSDGSAVNFELWGAGQPDDYRGMEDCVHDSYGSDLKWNDDPCSSPTPFVCASRIGCLQQLR